MDGRVRGVVTVTALSAALVAVGSARGFAQETSYWSQFSLAGAAAAAQDSMLGGKVPEKDAHQDSSRDRDVFEVKQVDVKPGQLKEELPVGEYAQPKWTTFRRFPGTRVYLQTPPGGVQFEQWIEFRKKKDKGGDDITRVRQELEFGLGNRMQLDLYMRHEHHRDGSSSTYDQVGYSAELRYALADWNEIWGNPTLYFEWVFNDAEADKIEPKLLLGGEIAPGWHWGSNFIHERSLAGHPDRTEEWAWSGSVSHTIVDDFFSVGATSTFSYESEPGTPQRTHTTELLLGPSIQIIPHPRAALNIEPLFGLTGESKRLKLFAVFSWHF